jgi:hypothetical protein
VDRSHDARRPSAITCPWSVPKFGLAGRCFARVAQRGFVSTGKGRQRAADRLTELGCREIGSLALCDALGPKLGSFGVEYARHKQGLLGESRDRNNAAP